MLDQNGAELGIGDKIQITGTLTEVDANTRDFLNCVFQLSQPGTVTQIDMNTRQVEMTSPSSTPIPELLDVFGREVGVGAAVEITGVVVGVDIGNPVNCFVQLDELMPPSGTRIRIGLTSTQVALTETALTQRRLLRLNEQIGQFVQPFRELYE
jgi:hypothetical protein